MFYLSILLYLISLMIKINLKSNILKSTILAASCLFSLITVFHFTSDYFTGTGINRAVIFHLSYGLEGAGFAEYKLLAVKAILLLVAGILISLLSLFYNIPKVKLNKRIRGATFTFLLFVAFGTNPGIHSIIKLNSNSHNLQNESPSLSKLKNYEYSSVHKVSERSSLPNIIFIFAESLEGTYFDKGAFPGLITELSSFKEQSIVFENIKQVWGSEWTIAGMTSTLCGVPFLPTSQGNSMGGVITFYSNTKCLSDHLKRAGYKLSFLQGSSLSFAGVGNLYSSHSFDKVKGKEEILTNLKPLPKLNPWGLYDDTLFDLAYTDLTRNFDSQRPTALFIATIDTHHPKGHISKTCKTIKNPNNYQGILRAVHCSDTIISNFIKKVQNNSEFKNTLIVLASDHLALRNTAFKKTTIHGKKKLVYDFRPSKKHQHEGIQKRCSD